MKKIITIVGIFAALAVGVFLFDIIRTDDWRTYENARYEFSIEYPPDWFLGDAEETNAGQVLISPDDDVSCYAYGFANALINDRGDPQSLDEFIDWLIFDAEVLERNSAMIHNKSAVHILLDENGGIREAVYALGTQTGIGFFCTYTSNEQRNNYKQIFDSMHASMRTDITQENTKPQRLAACSDLLVGLFVPFKDMQIFFDDRYTEVTITSREAWDQARLPDDVRNLELQGYTCYPMPSEYENVQTGGNELAQPAVTLVEWSCELEYEEWEYINGLEFTWPSNDFNDKWTNCVKEDCFAADGGNSHIWLCTK